jgi:hypothetical protein
MGTLPEYIMRAESPRHGFNAKTLDLIALMRIHYTAVEKAQKDYVAGMKSLFPDKKLPLKKK